MSLVKTATTTGSLRLKNEPRDVRADRDRDHDGNRDGRDYRNYGDRDRNYGYRDYDHDDYNHDRDYAAGGWIMPRGYYGGACGWANHLRNVYRHDEYTGHPGGGSRPARAVTSCGTRVPWSALRLQ